MMKLLLGAILIFAAGCGSPGMPGRGATPDSGSAFGGPQDSSFWTCTHPGCTQRCAGEKCGFEITLTGVRPAAREKESAKEE